ncbi:MAG: hypothetical protein GY854_24885 [Deltaproteobacteria bacterium]|nr:hypothetical protein [Deltaproteobacteria bacterium]
MNTKKKDLSLCAFIEEQRARYKLSKTELASIIAREHTDTPRTLFGISLQCNHDLDEAVNGSRKYRFPNELSALRAYVRAELGMRGTSSPLARLAKNADDFGNRSRTRRSRDLTVRVRGKKMRNWTGSDKTEQLCDLVDVGARLSQLPSDVLELLVSYYVLRRNAKDLAKEQDVDPAKIGGRLSAALRALRRSLAGLIPPPRNSTVYSNSGQRRPMTEDDLLQMRRVKVARMLKKRIVNEIDQEAS